MKYPLARTIAALFAMASFTPCAEAADRTGASVPKDTRIHSRPAISDDFRILPKPVPGLSVVDAVVSNIDPSLKDNPQVGMRGELSIAVDSFGRRIVLTDFEETWGDRPTAPLWLSTNAGKTWTKEFTINPPPRVGSEVLPCPCDQTVDFTSFGDLAGTFLTFIPETMLGNVFSARSGNLTTIDGAFNYFTVGEGVAQRTNHLVPSSENNADQPWLLVGRFPGISKNGEPGLFDRVYVAYDDSSVSPADMRVAVAAATSRVVLPGATGKLNFTTDKSTGSGGGPMMNPGHRLAVDPTSFAVYSLFQRFRGPGDDGSRNIDYMLNRSTDGGKTWTLNDSGTGIIVATADSDQPGPPQPGPPPTLKFCGVNALLGGVDHAAVDPTTGDVVYVFGDRDPVTNNNRLAMKRLTPDGTGGLTPGKKIFITGQVQAAIPSVAITANHTIGVFYYTCDDDGTSSRKCMGPKPPPECRDSPPSEFPIITAHFSISTDLGKSFVDNVLQRFRSPELNFNLHPRQRVLGDYMQVKAIGNTFYGGFAGNRLGFYPASKFSVSDPIFFRFNTLLEP